MRTLKFTLLGIILFCLFGSVYCINSVFRDKRKTQELLQSIKEIETLPKEVIIKETEPNKNFLALAKEKSLFGKEVRDLKVLGILGNEVLIDKDWYTIGKEKNGILILSVNDDKIVANVDSEETELKFWLEKAKEANSKSKPKESVEVKDGTLSYSEPSKEEKERKRNESFRTNRNTKERGSRQTSYIAKGF